MRLIVIAAALAIAAPALAEQLTWIADQQNGCRVRDAFPQDNETIEWKGPCRDGLANGKGVLRWFISGTEIERDEGEWRDGLMNGRVKITFSTGAHFEGEFRDDRPDGDGSYTDDDGQVYSGQWKNGCFDQDGRRMFLSATPQDCGITQ
jgi:hypothetical protein